MKYISNNIFNTKKKAEIFFAAKYKDEYKLSTQSSFINIDSMRQYIIYNEKNPSQFADDPFIDYDLNLDQIGVKEFTWDQCVDMFKSFN